MKRFALAVVAALGIAMISAAPAFAAAINVTFSATVTSASPASSASPATVGTLISADLYAKPALAPTGSDSMTATFKLADFNGIDDTGDATFTSNVSPDTGVTVSNVGAVYSLTFSLGATNAAHKIGTISYLPDEGNRHQLTVSTVNGTLADTNAALALGTVVTAPVSGYIYTAGTNVTVASSGTDSQSGTAITGGYAKIDVFLPAHAASATYLVTTTGMQITAAVDGALVAATVPTKYNGADYSGGVLVTTAATTVAADTVFTVVSSSPGSGLLSVNTINLVTGAPSASSVEAAGITWLGASSLSPSPNKSTVFATGTVSSVPTADDGMPIIVDESAGPSVERAIITATINDGNGNPINGASVTGSISGPGSLGIATDGVTLNSPAVGPGITVNLAAGTNVAQIAVWSDGRAGVSTITISSGAITLATKTVTFFGPTVNLVSVANYGSVSSTATHNMWTVTATDANGVRVRNLALIASSDSISTIALGFTCGTENTYSATAPAGTYNCWASSLAPGQYGAIAPKFALGPGSDDYNPAPGAVNPTSNAASLLISTNTIKSISMSFDKASYTVGARAILTVTALDANGNPVADDGTYTSLYTFSVNRSNTTVFPTTPTFVGGKQAIAVYMPISSGTFTATAVIGTVGVDPTLQGKSISATAQVTAPVNTDTANAAASANSASQMVAALSTTVASFVASITADLKSMSVLVKKIMVKLKIK